MGEDLVYKNGFCGIETDSGDDIDYNLSSGFHFVFTPVVTDRAILKNKGTGTGLADQLPLNTLKWSNRLVGMISSWIDLDSDDEILRKDSEATLQEEINLASKLSLQACLLPTPKGSSCTNYVRCLNCIMQNQSNMQFLLRIPLEEPDNDSDVGKLNNMGESQTNSLDLWRSFHGLCDHKFQNQLFVAFDFPRSLPSAISLEHWSNESLGVAIVDSKTLKKDRHGNSYRVEYHRKLMTWLFKHSVKIVLSRNVPSETLISSATNASNHGGDYSLHPLRSYFEYVTFIHGVVFHQTMNAHSEPRLDDDKIEDNDVFGTTAFAIKYKTGVIIGADSRQIRFQDGVIFDTLVKQYGIGDHICMTFAGFKTTGLKIVTGLREKIKSIKNISVSMLADLARELMGMRTTQDSQTTDVHLIIVGVHDKVREIYKVLPWEKIGNINLAIVGAPAALTIDVPEHELTREEAKEIVFQGIRRAKIVSYSTGGPIRLVYIEDDGSVDTEVAWPEDPKSSLSLHEWGRNGFTMDG